MASAVCLFSIALCGLDYVNQGVHQGIQEIVGYTTPNTFNNGNHGNHDNVNSGGQNWLNDLYYGRTTTRTPTANFPSRVSAFQNNHNDVPISPCPDMFYYELNGNDWTGIVSLQNIQNAEFVKLNLQMTIRAKLVNNYAGRIEIITPNNAISSTIQNNRPLLFRVNFPFRSPLPKVTGIYVNRQLICSGSGDKSFQTSTLNLNFDLTTGITSNIAPQTQPTIRPTIRPTQAPIYKPQIQTTKFTQPPRTQEPRTEPATYRPQTQRQTFTAPTQAPSQTQYGPDSQTCGQPILQGTGFIVGGKVATRGQWPWLVAYHNVHSGKSDFVCGGSLISRQHVVTSAHCIQEKQSRDLRMPQNALFYIGKHNLKDDFETGFQKVGAQRFDIHPQWDAFSEKYDADIAMIVLVRKVEYTKYIRPICIWLFDDDVREIENTKGVVAGWGKDENGNLSEKQPKFIHTQVVPLQTCLLSSANFLSLVTERTFCAGGITGEGPCNGDSGGGFVINRNGRWLLRGLVSVGITDPLTSSCDPNFYVVFTDVAKFTPWVMNYISN